MDFNEMKTKARAYLRYLCIELPTRQVGSQGNQSATDFFARTTSSFGFLVDNPAFACLDWTEEGATLTVSGAPFDVFPSPYSLGCQVRAPLAAASTVDELETADLERKIVLLRGELTKEQLMPKYFPFYNPEEHQRILGSLEAKKPIAIIAATSHNPELAGGVYPFPLIEDGDFDIPSVFMTEEQGRRLAAQVGEEAVLESKAWRIPSSGCNVTASKMAEAPRRIVLTAHIDSKRGTPGALDNASGVVVLLLLAELLEDFQGRLGIEIVALNGEDYYAAPGEIHYLQMNQGKLDRILLNINLDAVGYTQGDTAYSLYECPGDLADLIRNALSASPGMVEGDQWYQGDHMVFVQNGVPALAITSSGLMALMVDITHTSRDTPDLVDPARLADVALALHELLRELDGGDATI